MRYFLQTDCTIMILVKVIGIRSQMEVYMMIKLNILNMENFLEIVNTCSGRVDLLEADGSRKDINKQYGIQNELQRQYRENENHLKMTLDIPVPKDYLSIVCYYAGDC